MKKAALYLASTLAATSRPSVVQAELDPLPPIAELIERAYPTWCTDANENRITNVNSCADGSPNGRFTPLYFHKYPGIGKDPALGAYPTPIDTRYPFENASPFFGQVGAGSIYHCPANFDGNTLNYKTHCPKVITRDDNGVEGAGHIAPHIALAAATRAYNDEYFFPLSDWFDFDTNACHIQPHILLKLIRKYYPRDPSTGETYYPPPHSEKGGAYPLEFRNMIGDTCKSDQPELDGELLCFDDHSGGAGLYPDYLAVGHDSPRYCTKEAIAADVPTDWCPYIFFGPNRGKYRHPHIGFSSLETYLANMVMKEECGTTWDDSAYPPPAEEGTHLHFPEMTTGGMGEPQPVVKDDSWVWPGPDGLPLRAVPGKFSVYNYGVDASTMGTEAMALTSTSSEGLGAGAIAGILIGTVAVVMLFAVAFSMLVKHSKESHPIPVVVTPNSKMRDLEESSVGAPPSVN